MALLPMTAGEAANAIGLNAMTEENLRALNDLVVQRIRQVYTMQQVRAGNQFRRGQHVTFFSPKRGRQVTAQITKINAKSINCTEYLEGGSKIEWRVSPSMCSQTP